MRLPFRNLAKRTLKRFDICVTRCSVLEQLKKESRAGNAIELLLELPNRHKAQLLKVVHQSRSQFGQDLFVLSELDFKTGGFFVEFGATNGIDLSNTYLLEDKFGWTGILAEPALGWHKDLKDNRHCHIETDCVWSESNSTLTFNETDHGEFSTINSRSSSDSLSNLRKRGRTYNVNTITLADLLDKYGAPKRIDYLSIDTEGSELDILKDFDFSKYQFDVITCEHNYGPQREQLFSLLTQNGYARKFEGISNVDDWYVRME